MPGPVFSSIAAKCVLLVPLRATTRPANMANRFFGDLFWVIAVAFTLFDSGKHVRDGVLIGKSTYFAAHLLPTRSALSPIRS